MFEDENFLQGLAMRMKGIGYPLTKEMKDQMASGVGPNGMCVGEKDPIALFLASWEGIPHKDTTAAKNDILPTKVGIPKRKEGTLLYDKDQEISLDDSPLEYFFMLYAKAFEKAVYIGAAMLNDDQEVLLREMWLMLGITSWKTLLNNMGSSQWCKDLEAVTYRTLAHSWPKDCPEDFRKVQDFALHLIPWFLAQYARKVLSKSSRWYLKDLSLLGHTGFHDAYSAVLSQTSVGDGFEEPEDTIITDALAAAEKWNVEDEGEQLERLKGEVDDLMTRVYGIRKLRTRTELLILDSWKFRQSGHQDLHLFCPRVLRRNQCRQRR
jgi:hypothetical protein